MKSILIGASGFVGSNLLRQMQFDALASSKNMHEFKGMHFDFAVIAAGDARKWYANQSPEEDLRHIKCVIDDVCAIGMTRIIHFSTVDVYGARQGTELELVNQVSTEPYGGHRYLLECELRRRFSDVTTVRLPGLYGPGLKKNIIFDLAEGRDLSSFNPQSAFQWFNLQELRRVVNYANAMAVPELNICAEPVTVAELLRRLEIPSSRLCNEAPVIRYDIRSCHAQKFSGKEHYMYSKEESLDGISRFLASLRQGT